MPKQLVTVEQFYRENTESLDLRLLGGDAGLGRPIREPTVNRPGLALAGHTKYFASRRIQVLGNAENSYNQSIPAEARSARYRKLFSYQIPCFVFCRDSKPDEEFLQVAEEKHVPVFQTSLITMRFINLATLALEVLFAPRGTEMGSMVEVHGVGVLIRGESGIGKSESILALIERGYSLVSDDVTRVMLLDNREIIGTSPDVTRNFMEVRGIGIVNVATLFGVRAVRRDKRLDLIISLRPWEEVKNVDRLGIEESHDKILGVKIPHIVIPVRPGRDLARLIEVASMQTKLKRTGYNPAAELDAQLRARMQAEKPI